MGTPGGGAAGSCGWLQTEGDRWHPAQAMAQGSAVSWPGHRFHVAVPANPMPATGRRRKRRTEKAVIETARGLLTNRCDAALRNVKWFAELPPGATLCSHCAQRGGAAAQRPPCAAPVGR